MQWIVLGNPLQTWLTAVGATILCMGGLWLLLKVVLRRYAAREGAPRGLVAQLLAATRFWLLAVAALSVGALFLTLPPQMNAWIGMVVFALLMVQVAFWANAAISYWLTRYETTYLAVDAGRVTTMRALTFIGRLLLFTLILLVILDNIPGVQITSLLAGLGIGGIAVALAVQNILADLFASLSISLDKPFVIGDFIIVGDYLGSVEHIGLKTTRIRSLSGELLIFPNNDLLGSRIRNYKRMSERRVVFMAGVTYQTPPELLEAIPTVLREIIESHAKTRFDRAHFKGYGDWALQFEAVYYVLDPDYGIYMDIQQSINLAVYRRFVEMGIEFAYPTRTLYVTQQQAQAAGPA